MLIEPLRQPADQEECAGKNGGKEQQNRGDPAGDPQPEARIHERSSIR